MATTSSMPSSSKLDDSKYVDIDMVLDRKGPWTADHFVGGQQVTFFIRHYMV
jgi:hypothetical protein